jgi:hypothetical protein
VKNYTLAALVATLALAVAAPALASSHGRAAPAAHIAKKCKKKHGKKKKCKKSAPAPVVTPPAPLPAALTANEVINQVILKAHQYCDVDADCFDYGYYYDSTPGNPYCLSKSTYSWTCNGYNDEDNGTDPPFTCEFSEVVERQGLNGITSHQDLTYGDTGWYCFSPI